MHMEVMERTLMPDEMRDHSLPHLYRHESSERQMIMSVLGDTCAYMHGDARQDKNMYMYFGKYMLPN